MKIGKLIGKGMTAEVYAVSHQKIIKLFYKSIPKQFIIEEFEKGKAIYNTGIPSPKTYEIVEIKGRYGILFERMNKQSMLKQMEKRPWKIISYGKKLARMHYKIHQATSSNFPIGKDVFIEAAKIVLKELSVEEEMFIQYINSLPTGNNVCHGDFHPDNILGSKVIDWTNVYIGHPLSDVARTYLLINTPFKPETTSKIICLFSKILKNILSKSYLKEYKKIAKVKTEDIKIWLPSVACNRLLEKIPGEKDWLIGIIKKGLK